jgi:integrase/recombinase XerD
MPDIVLSNNAIKIKSYDQLPPHITRQQFDMLINQIQYDYSFKKSKKAEYFKSRDLLLLNLLWETGGRVGDIVNVKRSDFDIEGKVLNLRVAKKKNVNTIPLSNDIIILYLTYIMQKSKYYSKFDLIFDLTKQRAWQIVRKYGSEIGLNKLHPHMFRHGLAIHLLQRGVPIPIISARLGHASTTTTMNYYLVITPEIQKSFINENTLK